MQSATSNQKLFPMEAEGDVVARQPIVKLTLRNWIWWRQKLKYPFVYKGYNNLFNAEWTKSNKSSPKLIKANAFGMSTLLSTISDELQQVLLQKDYFLESLEALVEACGQNPIITLLQKLFDLVNLTYDPNTSLANHAYKFFDLYKTFQNCAAGNTFQMEIGEGAIASILLMIIGQASSLTGLVQTLYYTTPFNLEQITNQLLVKDSQRSKKPVDSTLYLNQSKQLYWPPHLNHSNPEQSKTGPRLSKPHFPKHTPQRTTPSGSTPTRFNQELNLEEKLEVFLDKYMKEYLNNSHSANQAKENSGEDRSTEDTQEDDEGFYVQMDQTNQLQSNVPVNFWDEAVKYSSLLINILPSRSLNWKSPVCNLLDHSYTIEPTCKLNKLIPFGLKAFVSRSVGSKVLLPSKPLLYLGPEDYSDAGCFLDPQNHRFVVSQDYTPTNIKFDYHSPDNVKKPISMLPNRPLTTTSSPNPNTFTTIPPRASSPKPTSQHQSCSPILSPPTQELPIVLTKTTEPEEPPTHQQASIAPKSPSRIPIPQRKGYSYIPTEGNPCSSTVDEDLLLNEEVPFKTALQDPNEAPRWKEVMEKEFNSLTSKNTGTLVPSLGTDKMIGGMWRLVRKQNEFGELLKYKACWVCCGNHQEHQVNYFDTYSTVARTELFKVLLSMLVNRGYSAYQFDVEAANYEVSGKEDWVWKLNKSLYGTKQAPQQWKAHLVKTLNTLGLTSKDTDECLFTNQDKTLFLHIHVDNGFIVSKSESMIEDLLTQINQTYTIKTKKNPTQHLGYTLNPENIHNIVAQTSTPFSKKTMQKAIGMLNYLTLHTWTDIMFTMNLLSQFVSKPTMSHWNLVKHLLRYLNGT
ncbi:hypothetical protein O181_049857 [Austropuccinia psidii MF-1]|uniref:Reverse transcriptase Ty1/copia-type domain-containing protein n=1 Tax=Austropuccinia psidii MF-1 TaxID=1389203 RepID=A0A9Q3DXU5_9BASI|nr:hypothetical protein [Austropuccinia psidii MF-1]